jgi:hypothetical protein
MSGQSSLERMVQHGKAVIANDPLEFRWRRLMFRGSFSLGGGQMNVKTRPVDDLGRVIEIPEAAAMFRVSQKQINTWIEEGKLALYQIPGISDRMVVLPSSIPEFVAKQLGGHRSSGAVINDRQRADSAALPNPDLRDIDPSFLEAGSKLLKTTEEIKRLISKGTLVVVDGAITPESVTAYQEFLHS